MNRGFGLLVPVMTVDSEAEATRLRYALSESGVRATVGAAGRPHDRPAFHLLVFPEDADRARAALMS